MPWISDIGLRDTGNRGLRVCGLVGEYMQWGERREGKGWDMYIVRIMRETQRERNRVEG